MPDLNAKQQQILEHDTRREIFDFLRSRPKPESIGDIAEACGIKDYANAFYHLQQLVDVELVEKVDGTNTYRVVGA